MDSGRYMLWGVMITPESCYKATEIEIERVQVPAREKEDLQSKLEMKIQRYYHKSSNGFTSVSFIPIGTLMQRFNMTVTSCRRHSVASRMGVETEAKSSYDQVRIMERIYEINTVK